MEAEAATATRSSRRIRVRWWAGPRPPAAAAAEDDGSFAIAGGGGGGGTGKAWGLVLVGSDDLIQIKRPGFAEALANAIFFFLYYYACMAIEQMMLTRSTYSSG